MQRPTPKGDGIFKRDWFQFYRKYDPALNNIDGQRILYKHIYADTAMKTSERNDFSVLQAWAKCEDGRIYLLDQERGKWEAPELEARFVSFCKRHEFQHTKVTMGVRKRKVEDKSSGTGLIQGVNKLLGHGYVEGIPRDKDKVSRAYSGAPPIARGEVVLPLNALWVTETDGYLDEHEKFSPLMTHKHDDQIDPTLDAVHDMLLNDTSVCYREAVGL